MHGRGLEDLWMYYQSPPEAVQKSTSTGIQGLHRLHIAKGMNRQEPIQCSNRLILHVALTRHQLILLFIYEHGKEQVHLVDDNLDVLV